MRIAFRRAVASLHARLGGGPPGWTWGKLHSALLPSLTGAAALGYGPRASGGDSWTVSASYGLPVSSDGPGWRMIVGWTGRTRSRHGNAGAGLVAEAIYPGGQSENPGSPWYENLIARWWGGGYLPMPPAGTQAAAAAGSVRWGLQP